MKFDAAALAIALPLACAVATARASDPIPAELVGIWATDASTFRGDALVSGAALYIAANGRAEQVGGPPPIGVKFEAVFDAGAGTLTIVRLFNPTAHGWQAVPARPGSALAFDPRTLSLSAADGSSVLHRRVSGLSPAVLKMAGLDCPPLECPNP